MEIVFSSPYYLWALIVVPVVILIHFISLRYSKKRAVKFANFIALARVSEKVGISSNFSVLFIRIIVLIAVVFAIAGTSLWFEGNRLEADYVIAIDNSASMLAEDLTPNRLDFAKQTAERFIDKLDYFYSSASIVSFSGTSYVHQTLTKDKNTIKEVISSLEINKIGGTNIGNALITGSNVLISSKNPKVIILITDGRDNVGIGYIEGIRYALNNNVMVFTVGIGSEEGYAGNEEETIGPLGIDEMQLQEIATFTGGEYYQVISNEDFETSFENILSTENRKVAFDLTFILMLVALGLLVLEWVLVNTRFKIIP
jgi:Ca-activated chloride channel homolog